MITSLESIKSKCGDDISIKKVRCALDRFEKMGFLGNQSGIDNRLITINNWDSYQCTFSQEGIEQGKARAKVGQDEGKDRATNNNDKNVKNEKKYAPSSSKFLSFREMEVEIFRYKPLYINYLG